MTRPRAVRPLNRDNPTGFSWRCVAVMLTAAATMVMAGCQLFERPASSLVAGFESTPEAPADSTAPPAVQSIGDMPATRHQPRPLESMVRAPAASALGELPPARPRSGRIDLESVSLDPQDVHVEADLAIEQLEQQTQLPAILENGARAEVASGDLNLANSPVAQENSIALPAIDRTSGERPQENAANDSPIVLVAHSETTDPILISGALDSMLVQQPQAANEPPSRFETSDAGAAPVPVVQHNQQTVPGNSKDVSPVVHPAILQEAVIPGSTTDPPRPLQRVLSENTDATTTAPGAPRQLTWREQLRGAIELLETGNGGQPGPADAVRLRLLRSIAGMESQPDSHLNPDNPLSGYWSAQLAALDTMLNGNPGEASTSASGALERRRATIAVNHLETAAGHLANHASLEVRNAAFCTEVQGFGQFTPAASRFGPGQQTLVYCEIRNHSTRRDSSGVNQSGGSWVAELRGQFVIIDEDNRVVHQHQYPAVEDVTPWRRKDFYMYFPLTLPNLAPGKYRLQLSIEDVVGRKFATCEPDLEFVAVASGTSAAPRTATSGYHPVR